MSSLFNAATATEGGTVSSISSALMLVSKFEATAGCCARCILARCHLMEGFQPLAAVERGLVTVVGRDYRVI